MKRLMIGSLVLALFTMVMSCGNKDAGTATSSESFGNLKMAVTLGVPLYDVVGVQVKVFPDTSKNCTDDTIYMKTTALISVPEPIADALFVLPAGDYKVCVIPVKDLANNTPSDVCQPAVASPVTVIAEVVKEITLTSMCNNPNGGLDVITRFEDLTLITDLAIVPSKFITTCETATITVTASDPNGGTLTYAWSVTPTTPSGSITPNATGETAVFSTDTVGEYKIKVVVNNTAGNMASLTFPIHVRACCDPTCVAGQVCCDGTCKTGTACEGCGDGVVTSPETCDKAILAGQAGACPTSCDDDVACTTDTMTGSAATCDVACTHEPIATCANDDGCCPAGVGCTNRNDNNCIVNCGDGVVTPPETCDKAILAGQPGACPTSCGDDDSCTTDAMTGSAANCDAACAHQAITVCSLFHSDGCCPDNCTHCFDIDCIWEVLTSKICGKPHCKKK